MKSQKDRLVPIQYRLVKTAKPRLASINFVDKDSKLLDLDILDETQGLSAVNNRLRAVSGEGSKETGNDKIKVPRILDIDPSWLYKKIKSTDND